MKPKNSIFDESRLKVIETKENKFDNSLYISEVLKQDPRNKDAILWVLRNYQSLYINPGEKRFLLDILISITKDTVDFRNAKKTGNESYQTDFPPRFEEYPWDLNLLKRFTEFVFGPEQDINHIPCVFRFFEHTNSFVDENAFEFEFRIEKSTNNLIRTFNLEAFFESILKNEIYFVDPHYYLKQIPSPLEPIFGKIFARNQQRMRYDYNDSKSVQPIYNELWLSKRARNLFLNHPEYFLENLNSCISDFEYFKREYPDLELILKGRGEDFCDVISNYNFKGEEKILISFLYRLTRTSKGDSLAWEYCLSREMRIQDMNFVGRLVDENQEIDLEEVFSAIENKIFDFNIFYYSDRLSRFAYLERERLLQIIKNDGGRHDLRLFSCVSGLRMSTVKHQGEYENLHTIFKGDNSLIEFVMQIKEEYIKAPLLLSIGTQQAISQFHKIIDGLSDKDCYLSHLLINMLNSSVDAHTALVEFMIEKNRRLLNCFWKSEKCRDELKTIIPSKIAHQMLESIPPGTLLQNNLWIAFISADWNEEFSAAKAINIIEKHLEIENYPFLPIKVRELISIKENSQKWSLEVVQAVCDRLDRNKTRENFFIEQLLIDCFRSCLPTTDIQPSAMTMEAYYEIFQEIECALLEKWAQKKIKPEPSIFKEEFLYPGDLKKLRPILHGQFKRRCLAYSTDVGIVDDIITDAKNEIISKVKKALKSNVLPVDITTRFENDIWNTYPSRPKLESLFKSYGIDTDLGKILDRCSDEILPELLKETLCNFIQSKKPLYPDPNNGRTSLSWEFLKKVYKDYPQAWDRRLVHLLKKYKELDPLWIKGIATSIGDLREPRGNKSPAASILHKISKDPTMEEHVKKAVRSQHKRFQRANLKKGLYKNPKRKVLEAVNHLMETHKRVVQG